MIKIPKRFVPAYKAVEKLSEKDRYLAAFVFGSVARGDAGEESDLDVKVIVEKDNECRAINHPVIGGVKLDISFESFVQLKESTQKEIDKGKRIPMLSESIIVFDKTGDLKRYKTEVIKTEPKKLGTVDWRSIQFMIYHMDNKAKRLLRRDDAGAVLSMGMNLGDLLGFHYQLQRRWWVSDKRLPADLRVWDGKMMEMVEKFVSVHEAGGKYRVWTEIIDYVLAPLGGRQPISEINCDCEVCKEDLGAMLV